MITSISKHIAQFFLKKEIIDIERLPVYQYGFEMMVSLIVGFASVILSGIILGEFLGSLLFYILFIGVRLFTGGFHADSYFKCKVTLVICCTSVLIAYKYINFSLFIIFILSLIFLITVILLSPVEHPNAPLSESDKKRNRIISIVIAITLTIINVLGYNIFPKFVTLSVLTLFVIALLIIIPKIQRR